MSPKVSEQAFYTQLKIDLTSRQRGVRIGAGHRGPASYIPVPTFAATALGKRIHDSLHEVLLSLTNQEGSPYIREIQVEAGRTIVTEGETGRDFYMLVQGHATIYGTNDAIIATLQSGDSFGELAVLKSDYSRMASAIADSRCILIAVNGALVEIDGRLKIIFKNAMLDIVEEKLFDAYGEIRKLREAANRSG